MRRVDADTSTATVTGGTGEWWLLYVGVALLVLLAVLAVLTVLAVRRRRRVVGDPPETVPPQDPHFP